MIKTKIFTGRDTKTLEDQIQRELIGYDIVNAVTTATKDEYFIIYVITILYKEIYV